MAAMHTVILMGAAWLMLQASVQPSDRYRDEFKLRPETARISPEFSINAWIVLLYAGRQGASDTASPGDPVDAAMETLREQVKTDGEWLFWYRLNNYSIAKQFRDPAPATIGLRSMVDPDACRSALMVANRSHVMTAAMPACELAQPGGKARTP